MPSPDEHIDEEFARELCALGVSTEDLGETDISDVYLVHSLWPGERRFSLQDIANKHGVSVDDVAAIRVASGFPMPEIDANVATERDLDFYSRVFKASEILGWDETLTLLRVVGATQSKVADAALSTFLVNVEPTLPENPDELEPGMLDEVRELVDDLSALSDTLLRKNLVNFRRDRSSEPGRPYETLQLAIGFADMAGSTELAERLPYEKIAEILSTFEATTMTSVNRFGGRVVKLIGDEILFSSTDPAVAAKIAFDLHTAVQEFPELPPVRIGLAAGEVLVRDGDIFGPAVNRAARIVKTATPGSILVTPVIKATAEADFAFSAIGSFDLPGFSALTELWRLDRARHDVSPEPEHDIIE